MQTLVSFVNTTIVTLSVEGYFVRACDYIKVFMFALGENRGGPPVSKPLHMLPYH